MIKYTTKYRPVGTWAEMEEMCVSQLKASGVSQLSTLILIRINNQIDIL